MGRAEDLFLLVSTNGESAIDDFISDRQSEELYLDFKRSADQGMGRRLDKDDRSNLAKAISGFGNSEGGIIVWGVDCRNLSALGDVAQAKFPIDNPKRFKSRLEGAVTGCTVPPHSTVQHAVIEGTSGNGFVVTLIPMSNLAPHQCLPELKYYMRAGSDFSPVPHAVLAGMFGRRPQSALFHNWFGEPPRFHPGKQQGEPLFRFITQMALHNGGPGIARGLYLNVEHWAPGPNSSMFIDIPSNQWISQEQVLRVSFSARTKGSFRLGPRGVTTAASFTIELERPFQCPLVIKLSYGCVGSPSKFIERSVSASELETILNPTSKLTSSEIADKLLPK